jgi:hypothetical protein
MIICNTTITILRGDGVDSWGDGVEADRPIQSRIPAAKMETNRQTERKDTDAPRSIRSYTYRVWRSIDVRDGDRFRDERDNQTYLVDKVVKPTVVVAAAPIRITARLIRETTNEEK